MSKTNNEYRKKAPISMKKERRHSQCRLLYLVIMGITLVGILHFVVSLPCVDANVATPYPGQISMKQPDGRNVTVFLRGHPNYGIFQTDNAGHPVVRDDNGWLVYALHHHNTTTAISSIDPRQRLRELRPSKRIIGVHESPYNQAPNVRELTQTHVFDVDPAILYRDLLSASGVVNDGNNSTEFSTEPGSITVLTRLNDVLCDGMPRTQWCPNNPIMLDSLGRSAYASDISTGTLNLIVILVKFSDQFDRLVSPKTDYERLFGDPTWGPTGCVSEFYRTMSGGKLKVTAHVEDWTLSYQSEEYWSFGNYGMTPEYAAIANIGLDNMDRRGTDWSQFDQNGDGVIDGIFIIHSGYAAECGGDDGFTGKPWGKHRIWSYRSSAKPDQAWTSSDGSVRLGTYATTSAYLGNVNQKITRIGVVVHEMGHMLGLPDMLSSGDAGYGVGYYDVMSDMWGPDQTQLYPGIMSAWSRITLGWITPMELTVPGHYQIKAAVDHPDSVYKIKYGFPEGEYLLLENRIQKSYDEKNTDQGLLVWHIDDVSEKTFMQFPGYPGQSGWPANGNHYQLAILQADGQYGLERLLDKGSVDDMYKAGMPDLGPGGSGQYFPNTDSYLNGTVKETSVRLSGFSDPGDVMMFTFSIDGQAAPPDISTPPPTNPLTNKPTRFPTPSPTARPTQSPTILPPTNSPTPNPTLPPTMPPTVPPTPNPTLRPTVAPSNAPTPPPTSIPTSTPTPKPTLPPTLSPSNAPTPPPTSIPTPKPTLHPTLSPSSTPTPPPTSIPTSKPTPPPTLSPSNPPTRPQISLPTPKPTVPPTLSPSNPPTRPQTSLPTPKPTPPPTLSPSNPPTTISTPRPSLRPTLPPSNLPPPPPTLVPTNSPTLSPTDPKTFSPTLVPTIQPKTASPTDTPITSKVPTLPTTLLPSLETAILDTSGAHTSLFTLLNDSKPTTDPTPASAMPSSNYLNPTLGRASDKSRTAPPTK